MLTSVILLHGHQLLDCCLKYHWSQKFLLSVVLKQYWKQESLWTESVSKYEILSKKMNWAQIHAQCGCIGCGALTRGEYETDIDKMFNQRPILLTWFNLTPSMDK